MTYEGRVFMVINTETATYVEVRLDKGAPFTKDMLVKIEGVQAKPVDGTKCKDSA